MSYDQFNVRKKGQVCSTNQYHYIKDERREMCWNSSIVVFMSVDDKWQSEDKSRCLKGDVHSRYIKIIAVVDSAGLN